MQLFALCIIFFLTSIVSVVTGSTSLITVPAMLQFGIEARSAVATNMLALTLLSLGGSLSFMGTDVIDRRRSPMLIILTLVGSVLGAVLLLVVPAPAIPVIISILMIVVALFSFCRPKTKVPLLDLNDSPVKEGVGYMVTFILAIYGGFFSGGYVTLLTAAFVTLFGMTYIQAVSTTKIVNLFSSLAATVIFIWRGLVDWRMGIILGIIMFVGALIGGRIALKLSNQWLRRIFLTAIIALALKTLLYDFVIKSLLFN
jgi:uncharacterized protein